MLTLTVKGIKMQDISKYKRIHCLGIGGIGLSAIAEILADNGHIVTGSDIKKSDVTTNLENKGIKIYYAHEAENVEGVDAIVYSSAVSDENPEVIRAKELELPLFSRAEVLGFLMDNYKNSIAICGTHGKTTVTSMTSLILRNANYKPTILVGGNLPEINGNVEIGSNEYFVTEACEYMDSFLSLRPNLGVILNIDSDHLDYFKDINHIYSSFLKYARRVPEWGTVIGCGDDPLVRKLMEEVNCNVISYGIDRPADWTASRITYNQKGGGSSFYVENKGRELGEFTIKLPGKHNIYNALASIAACDLMGLTKEQMKKTLSEYGGIHRRFEIKGRTGKKAIVIDDYAHHPSEVKATINAAKNYPHNRIWCVFQPHTYTRTKELFNEFTDAFSGVDRLILADIYAAREKDPGNINSKMLAEAIAEKGMNSIYMSGFEEIAAYLNEHSKQDDLIITMGAGDVYKIGDMLLQNK